MLIICSDLFSNQAGDAEAMKIENSNPESRETITMKKQRDSKGWV